MSIRAVNGRILDEGDERTDITTDHLRLVAGDGIGQIGEDVDSRETAAATLAASSGPKGISLMDKDDVVVDMVGQVPVNRVQPDGTTSLIQDKADLSDLETSSNGSIVLRKLNGFITVNNGDADAKGVSADGTGNVLLEARGTGREIVLNSDVLSGSGNITIIAARNVSQAVAKG